MWEPVTGGESGAHVSRQNGLYCKLTPDAGVEAATLEWLRAQGIPAAEVIDVGEGWLVTREVQGVTAAQQWPTYLLTRVVDALVDITRALHALPADGCPFDQTLVVAVPLAHVTAAAGQVDLEDLDDSREGWTTAQLLAALDHQVSEMRARETPVVTHGDWCLPNLMIDPQTIEVVGVLDTGRAGLADACQDTALMSRSLFGGVNSQFGPEQASRFLRRCGHQTRDDDKLAFYQLLDEFF